MGRQALGLSARRRGRHIGARLGSEGNGGVLLCT